jgi:hypothetical protein
MKIRFVLFIAVFNIAGLHAQTSVDSLVKEDFFGAWEYFEGSTDTCENGNNYVFILKDSPTYISYEINDDGCHSGEIAEYEWKFDGENLHLIDGFVKFKVISLQNDTLTIEYKGKIRKYRRIEFPGPDEK